MSWTPVVEIDSTNKTETELKEAETEFAFKMSLLSALENIELQLRLLNERIEEALETGVTEQDVDHGNDNRR